MRRWTKRLVILLVLTAGGWSAWWYAGAAGHESGIARWFEKQRQRGWTASVASLEVTGYPTDFSTSAREVSLADPRAGWSWQAPLIQAVSRAHAPTRIEVTWPNSQRLSLPGGDAKIRAASIRSLLDVRPGQSLELRETWTEIESLVIRGSGGMAARLKGLNLKLVEQPSGQAPGNSYRLELQAHEARMPPALVAAIDPTGWLKPLIERMTLRTDLTLARPLDRRSLRLRNLDLRRAVIEQAGFRWGDMALTLRGRIRVDQRGYPNGRVRVEAREWRQMLRLAAQSGLIRRKMVKTIAGAIGFLTAFSGTGDTLKLTLKLKRGKVLLGVVPIARAPRLAAPGVPAPGHGRHPRG